MPNLLYGPTLTSIHDYWENHCFDYTDLCGKVALLFNTVSRFVIALLPRSKHLLISWLQSLSTVILEITAQENKICCCFYFFPSICHEVMGTDAMILVFWMLSFKPAFSFLDSFVTLSHDILLLIKPSIKTLRFKPSVRNSVFQILISLWSLSCHAKH